MVQLMFTIGLMTLCRPVAIRMLFRKEGAQVIDCLNLATYYALYFLPTLIGLYALSAGALCKMYAIWVGQC